MNDLISRQAAIDAMNTRLEDIKLTWRGKVKKGEIAMYLDMRGVIETLPSAQPERQRGEWIEISSINHTYKCSECGRLLVNITDGKNNVAKNYPYCHCGADMRGESE